MAGYFHSTRIVTITVFIVTELTSLLPVSGYQNRPSFTVLQGLTFLCPLSGDLLSCFQGKENDT